MNGFARGFAAAVAIAGMLYWNADDLEAAPRPRLPELAYPLGTAEVRPTEDTLGVYSVSVSGALTEKSQEVRFVAYWSGPDAGFTGGSVKSTRIGSIKTGKSKTLGQVLGVVQEAFSRFLSAPAAVPASQELAKIGDIKYGGELRIVAESGEVLRFDYLKPTGLESLRFGRKEIAEFQKILSKAKPPVTAPQPAPSRQ